MKRFYCDCCDSEGVQHDRPKGKVVIGTSEVSFEIMFGTKMINSGDVCLGCLLDAINTLDERKKKPANKTAQRTQPAKR